MHLPEPSFLDATNQRLVRDLPHDVADALSGVRHEQHEALRDGEADAENEHGEGDNGAEEAVEPEEERDGKEGQKEHDCAAGEGQEMGGVGEEAWE